ncbi:MAG TPA: chemotaxis protein CheW [Pyrinomonadaceae bacterium]|jgi:purine-binding chemotaxis protein CheW
MTEPELLRTLERLENEEFLDVNPELPLPATAGGEDYLSILQDLRSALGEPDEPLAEPETSFSDPQNILELDAEQEIAANAPEFENELELLPETAGFDFSGDETYAAFSNFEFKLPDEVLPQDETRVEPKNNDSISESADFETANFEALAEPENLSPFFHSSAEPTIVQPDVAEEADSLPLEEFLLTQEFSSQSVFEENSAAESLSNFDFPVEADEEANQNDFAFVPSFEETEFPEILHDEEQAEEFSSEDFSSQETLSNETISDFEPENFAADTEYFSEFLPEPQRDFLSELERQPEFPQFKATETSFEMLPEPSFADESAETNETRSPFVVFKLDAEYFAFPASAVAEIGHEPQFSALPFVPSWFSGITNLRGDVIAVLDLRGLWEKSAAAPDARRKMLVVRSEKENLTVGLLIDAVSEIRYLGESEINPAQEFSDQPFAFCVQGASRMNETFLHILDVERLLASPKLRQL